MKTATRYMLFGALFGATFPLVSALILSLENQLAFTPATFLEVHRLTRLQYLVDTAPLFLGFFAWLAGRRQQQAEKLYEEVQQGLQERVALIERLQTSETQLKTTVERRLVQLRTAALVAQQAVALRDLTELLDQTAELISEKFGFYHVGIFLIDANGEYAVLQAANSPGGQRMLSRGHRLKVGELGIVGYVAARGEARIALDVGQDAVYFNNPDLPETRSEMALPLKVGTHIIGVLDVQSQAPAAFNEEDAVTLQIMADSLAIAIENSRLFTQTQMNLEEIQALNRQYLQRAWRDALSRHPRLEYLYESRPSKQLEAPAVPTSENPAAAPEAPRRLLEVPIVLRDQVLGKLTIEADPLDLPGAAPDEWTPEELALVQAAADQAAQALENARLLEETQQRTAQERTAAEIASRIWSAPDTEAILRVTLQALSSALQASEGLIHLEVRES